MMTGLKGKTAIVTGGTGGLGRAIVERFVRESMVVVVAARKPGSVPEGAELISADVTRESDVRDLFAKTASKHGGVHILVNAAGGYLGGKKVSDVSLDEWQQMMSLNLLSAFLCTREALRHMQGKPYGRIINISAMTALEPAAGKAPYAISKAGVSLLTEIVAQEVKGTGITINAIAPGIILTDANKSSMPKADSTKWVKPADIADTICQLCSESNGVISGTTLRAFGGM
ncbi:MAG TPA: SDR family oxidoreductase [Bacteroidota bacterium]